MGLPSLGAEGRGTHGGVPAPRAPPAPRGALRTRAESALTVNGRSWPPFPPFPPAPPANPLPAPPAPPGPPLAEIVLPWFRTSVGESMITLPRDTPAGRLMRVKP